MRILISGSHGLIGQALVSALSAEGHEITALSKEQLISGVFPSLEGFDVVIHLAGENIAGGLWTARKKRSLWESRVETSSRLALALSQLKNPPSTVVAASAAGFYGFSQREEPCTESSSKGEGFLADLCFAWENAWKPCEKRGLRVVYLRLSPVLSPKGGILQKLLLPFKLCLGGKIGDGKQWISWISLSDVVGSIFHLLKTPEIQGPVNLASPHSVRQQEFAALLGKVLHRPVLLPLPKIVVKAIYGEKGETLLLGSSYVIPRKLTQSGYRFTHSHLLSCLQDLL